MQAFSSLWFGIALPWRAFRLILSQPKLLLWSLLPIAITLVLYAFALNSLQSLAHAQMLGILDRWGVQPAGFVAFLFRLAIDLVLLVLAAVTFSFTAGIAAAPFNDFLAERAEYWATPSLTPAPKRDWRGHARLILTDIGKSIGALVLTILALLVSWIPVIGVLGIAATFLLVSFQFASYPQTRRGQGFGEGLGFVGRHALACLGFGAAIATLFSIPVIGVLALPVAVVGGTLLVARAPGTTTLPRLL